MMNIVGNRMIALGCVCVAVLAAYNVFHGLSEARIESFDEARHGVTAYEMMKSGDYIFTTYRDVPDYWNLKPPLGGWLIVGSYRLLGTSGLALRMPASLSALGCVVLVMLVLYRRGMPLAGLLAGIILTTTYRFMCSHAGRTGDYDAQLAFIICAAMLIVEHHGHALLKYVALGLLIAASFLLKSFAAVYTVMMVGAGVVVLMLERRVRPWHLVVLAASALVPVLLWAVLRWQYDDMQFFRTMYTDDLVRRSTMPIEGHYGGYDYYVQRVVKEWWPLIGVCLLGVLTRAQKRTISFLDLKRYAMYVLWFSVPLVIASLVKSKAWWYLNPAYPGLAVLLAIGLASFLEDETMLTIDKAVMAAWIVSALWFKEQEVLDKEVHRDNRSQRQTLIAGLQPYGASNVVLYSSFWVPGPHPVQDDGRLYDYNQDDVFVATVVARLEIRDCTNVAQYISESQPGDLLIEKPRRLDDAAAELVDVVASNKEAMVWRRKP